MTNIAIFASGSGTNAENIVHYFNQHHSIKISSIYTNNPKAKVIERAKRLEVPFHVFNRIQFYDNKEVLNLLESEKIDFIVLAGFLWLVPKTIIQKYPNKIINIHPALLPKYGGKGMYGEKVHIAVKENNDKETGITIHYVNENYDEGDIIFQSKCDVSTNDSVDEIAEKVHQLEYKFYPIIIEQNIN